MEKDSSNKNPNLRKLQAISGNWVVILFVLSAIGSVIGWAVYDISIFQPLEEIAAKQKEYKRSEQQLVYRQRIVKRHIDLANSFLNVSQLSAAKREFEKALELDPNNIDAHFGKMKAEVFDPIAAREYIPEIAELRLKAILDERPNDPHVLSMLGDVYRPISKNLSMEYYDRAISQDPSVASAFAGKALLLDKDKDKAKSISMYEKALSLSGWNQTYLNNLGYQYYQRSDYDKAIEKYRLLLDLDYRYLLSYYTLSNSYRLNGELYLANWYQERLIDLFSDEKIKSLPRNSGEWFFHTDKRIVYFYDFPMKTSYAFYNAAVTAYLRGDKEIARSYVQKAKEINSPLEWLVKDLLRYDITTLRAAQEEYSGLLEEFSNNYL